jgi:phage-related protein
MKAIRPLLWVGSAKKDLAAMPDSVQDIFGYALHLAQHGRKHSQSKALSGFGDAGILEVVEHHQGGAYRAVYTVRYASAVYVLHCFQKKSPHGIVTAKQDMALITARLKTVAALVKDNET